MAVKCDKGGGKVNDVSALRALKRGDEKALEWIIDRYSSYVSTIIANILGAFMTDAGMRTLGSILDDIPVRLISQGQIPVPGMYLL